MNGSGNPNVVPQRSLSRQLPRGLGSLARSLDNSRFFIDDPARAGLPDRRRSAALRPMPPGSGSAWRSSGSGSPGTSSATVTPRRQQRAPCRRGSQGRPRRRPQTVPYCAVRSLLASVSLDIDLSWSIAAIVPAPARPPLTVKIASSNVVPLGAFATAKAGKAGAPENEVEM
jgi:hypothetical protein